MGGWWWLLDLWWRKLLRYARHLLRMPFSPSITSVFSLPRRFSYSSISFSFSAPNRLITLPPHPPSHSPLLSLSSFLDQVKGLNENRDKVKVFKKPDSQGTGWMFLVVLEGMVYTVGAIFAAAALYLGTLHFLWLQNCNLKSWKHCTSLYVII